MKIEQIYTSCLAQGAYYIESNGEVAIIDPLRETQQYVDKATANNAKIKFIFETHIHADFVSGHVDLAKKPELPLSLDPIPKQLSIVTTLAITKHLRLEILRLRYFTPQVIPWNL